MKNRNPFLSVIVLWVCAICVSLAFCIVGIVFESLFLAISQLVWLVFDSVWLGIAVCKFNSYKELAKKTKDVENILNEFGKLMETKEKDPFKEFDSDDKSRW